MKDTHNYRYWQKMTSEKLRKKVKQLFKLFEANKISNDEYEISSYYTKTKCPLIVEFKKK